MILTPLIKMACPQDRFLDLIPGPVKSHNKGPEMTEAPRISLDFYPFRGLCCDSFKFNKTRRYTSRFVYFYSLLKFRAKSQILHYGSGQ